MKAFQILLITMPLTNGSFVHAQDSVGVVNARSSKVSFVAYIDSRHATKDVIYLNGYLVNIPYDKGIKLNGKKVLIKGKVTIVKGLAQHEDGLLLQGRAEDARHIFKPRVQIMGD